MGHDLDEDEGFGGREPILAAKLMDDDDAEVSVRCCCSFVCFVVVVAMLRFLLFAFHTPHLQTVSAIAHQCNCIFQFILLRQGGFTGIVPSKYTHLDLSCSHLDDEDMLVLSTAMYPSFTKIPGLVRVNRLLQVHFHHLFYAFGFAFMRIL